ncbi:hypothetical protein QBC47DRAFT_283149, partial [Echria macrotheca]
IILFFTYSKGFKRFFVICIIWAAFIYSLLPKGTVGAVPTCSAINFVIYIIYNIETAFRYGFYLLVIIYDIDITYPFIQSNALALVLK